MMSPRKRNLITGVVILAALSGLVWMILTFSGRAMNLLKPTGTPVVFLSDRADGLSDGSPVLYRGVQVGKVAKVHRSTDNAHVRIDGEIENNPPLPSNLVGQIHFQSQLGSSSQIDLRVAGEPKGTLSGGQEIEIRFTGNSIFPPEFTDLIDQARHQELIAHVDQAIVSLRSQAEKFGGVMTSVQDIIGDPKIQGDLRQAVANIRLVTERADKITANLDKLSTDANTTMGSVHETVTNANHTIDRLGRQMADDLDKLGLVFHQFQEVSEKINKGKGTAGALVNDPKLYDELTDTARELSVVAKSLSRLVDQWEHEGVALKLAK